MAITYVDENGVRKQYRRKPGDSISRLRNARAMDAAVSEAFRNTQAEAQPSVRVGLPNAGMQRGGNTMGVMDRPAIGWGNPAARLGKSVASTYGVNPLDPLAQPNQQIAPTGQAQVWGLRIPGSPAAISGTPQQVQQQIAQERVAQQQARVAQENQRQIARVAPVDGATRPMPNVVADPFTASGQKPPYEVPPTQSDVAAASMPEKPPYEPPRPKASRVEREQQFRNAQIMHRAGMGEQTELMSGDTFFQARGADEVVGGLSERDRAYYDESAQEFNRQMAEMLAAHGTQPWASVDEYTEAIQALPGYSPFIHEHAKQMANRFMPENLQQQQQDAQMQAQIDAIPPGESRVINGQVAQGPPLPEAQAEMPMEAPEWETVPWADRISEIERVEQEYPGWTLDPASGKLQRVDTSAQDKAAETAAQAQVEADFAQARVASTLASLFAPGSNGMKSNALMEIEKGNKFVINAAPPGQPMDLRIVSGDQRTKGVIIPVAELRRMYDESKKALTEDPLDVLNEDWEETNA